MNSIKFSFNQFIALFFIILGIGVAVMAVRVSVKSFQQSLLVDESKASSKGLTLDKKSLKGAIEELSDSWDYGVQKKEASGSGEKKDSEEINLEEEKFPQKVEIVYLEKDDELIEEIKTLFPDGVEFSVNLAKEGLDESKVIYKNEYIKLKNSLVTFLENKDFIVEVFKRKEDKEFDLTIELKNISE